MKDKKTIFTLIAGIAIGVILILSIFCVWQIISQGKQINQNSANVAQIANFLNTQIEASQQAQSNPYQINVTE